MHKWRKKLLSKLPDPKEWIPEWSRKELLELQAIWTELEEFLEYSAYAVIGKQGVVIFEKFPASSRNDDDRAAFEAIKFLFWKFKEGF